MFCIRPRLGFAPCALIAATMGSVLFVNAPALAERLPLANSELDTRGDRAHGQALADRQLPQWRLTAEAEGDITAWLGGDDGGGWGVAIAEGGVLEQTIMIPALAEGRDSANWYGLIALDLRGAGEGRGRAGAVIELIDPATDETLVRGGGFTAHRAPTQDQPNDTPLKREWLYLSPDQLTELAGQEILIRISGLADRAVVLGGAHFYQFHTAPTRRLQNKPNGRSGPDFMDAGALGFSALLEHQHAALSVIGVRDDGPAHDAGLRQGDCIIAINRVPLGVNDANPGWQWANEGHEATLGRAVESAFAQDQSRARRGLLDLQVLRAGRPVNLRMRLTQGSAFADTFPFDDPKADQMYSDIVAWVARNQRTDGSWDGDPKRTCMGALTLLGTHDPQYAEQIKKAMDWTMNRHPEPNAFGNLGYWGASYAGILGAEYFLATGDERVLLWMERILIWAHNGHHNSKWDLPTLGHGPGGLPYGNKALVAPAVHLLVFDALAKRCGIESPYHDLIMPTLEHAWSDPAQDGHGALGYNASYKDLGEFWSRTGLFALALTLNDEHPEMRGPLSDIMRQRYPWLRNSHAYGEPGGALGLIGLSVADPDDFAHVMRELRWTFALAWEPGHGLRFTQSHMGSPYMGEEAIINTAYGTLFSAIHQGLHITGSNERNWLDVSAIPSVLTPVAIRRNRAGLVTLACRVPGPTIHFTLDGSTPTATSPVYNGPIDLAQGGMIRALPFDESGAAGEAAQQTFGLAKQGWQVVEATGAPTPEQAIARAGAAIDSDPAIAWLTDTGQAAVVYPHHIVIDLGQRTPIAAIALHFPHKDNAPAQLALFVSDDADAFGDAATRETYAEHTPRPMVALDAPTWGRYIRIEMTTGLSARPMVQLAELDVQSVVPTIETTATGIALAAPAGFTVRYTTDGSTPTATSNTYDAPIALEEGQSLNARCFADEFAGAVVTLERD